MSPQNFDSYTTGAQRSLRIAQYAAAESSQFEPRHLLGALWQEQTRAAEILANVGINESAVRGFVGLPAEAFMPSADEPIGLYPDTECSLAILEAERLAATAGRHAEVGTEHLLWGLSQTASGIQRWLNAHGIDESQLADQVVTSAGFETAPLPVDLDDVAAPVGGVLHDRGMDRLWHGAMHDLGVDVDVLAKVVSELQPRLALAAEGIYRSVAALREVVPPVRSGLWDPPSARSSRQTNTCPLRAVLDRLNASTRVLLDTSRVMHPSAGAALQQLERAINELDNSANRGLHRRTILEHSSVYLLVTHDQCMSGAGPTIRGALRGGVRAIQVREKDMPDGRLLNYLNDVRAWTSNAGALLIVNDRPDLALLCDADGVHVGQDDLRLEEARAIVGDDKLVGVSTHDICQARTATAEGADYIGVGPTFPSRTKSFDAFPGVDFVREVSANVTCPAFAIGGIDSSNVAQIRAAGAKHVAVSSAICRADDPQEAAEELMRLLG